MGQQQQMVAEQQAGGALRRNLVLMTVVALMVVMLAMSVSPAYARPPFQEEPRYCANGVAQTFGQDDDHDVAEALRFNCYLPIGKK